MIFIPPVLQVPHLPQRFPRDLSRRYLTTFSLVNHAGDKATFDLRFRTLVNALPTSFRLAAILLSQVRIHQVTFLMPRGVLF
jgi:hypothetical protein